jgi:hypothetical protein
LPNNCPKAPNWWASEGIIGQPLIEVGGNRIALWGLAHHLT